MSSEEKSSDSHGMLGIIILVNLIFVSILFYNGAPESSAIRYQLIYVVIALGFLCRSVSADHTKSSIL